MDLGVRVSKRIRSSVYQAVKEEASIQVMLRLLNTEESTVRFQNMCDAAPSATIILVNSEASELKVNVVQLLMIPNQSESREMHCNLHARSVPSKNIANSQTVTASFTQCWRVKYC